MATGKYYILSDIKPMLSIADTDVVDDILLNNFGVIADQQVQNDLSHKLDDIPVLNANITNDIIGASNFYVCFQYKIKKQDFDGSENFKKLYDNMISSILNKLQSEPSARSGRVAVNKGYTTAPLNTDE